MSHTSTVITLPLRRDGRTELPLDQGGVYLTEKEDVALWINAT